jgi:hypothetical protein
VRFAIPGVPAASHYLVRGYRQLASIELTNGFDHKIVGCPETVNAIVADDGRAEFGRRPPVR